MEKTINLIVEGGKATAGPPLAPALAPMGINIGQVVAEINKATKDFAGVKVPVKVIVETSTKEFKIEVGSPPTSELIKQAAKVQKGGGTKEFVGDIPMKEIISIAKKKRGTSLAKDLKGVVKEVVGTCVSMAIKIDGKDPREVMKEIEEGKYDSSIKE